MANHVRSSLKKIYRRAILASGGNASGSGGGGSGGSIWIQTGTFSGAGNINAKGGNTTYGYSGSGGGGRIAIYSGASSFSGGYSVAGGTGNTVGGSGGVGTIYFGKVMRPFFFRTW